MPFPRRRLLLYPLLLPAILTLGGCAGLPIASFEQARPILTPETYFVGHTHSWGIFETPSGQPERLIKTTTDGHLAADGLHFEQDIFFPKSKPSHRSWLIHRIDEHHYTATGTGIVGVAHGTGYGNVFHLDFTLDAVPGNPLAHVHMSQWMYLQPDGITMINRDTVTKAGIILTQVTEQFVKDR